MRDSRSPLRRGEKVPITIIDVVLAIGNGEVRKSVTLQNVKDGSCPNPTCPGGKKYITGRELKPAPPV